MSRRAKIAAGAAGVVVLAVGIFFLLVNREDIPLVGGLIEDEPAVCQLNGREPKRESVVERPAVAVKIENAAVAYPLSGLDKADIVYEEPVEGGATRFMAMFHCFDSAKAGPVRSAREIDPAIMTPLTRILAFSGANRTVLDALDAAEVVQVEENTAGDALQRIPREGLSFEHTLYANTGALRRVGKKGYDESPPEVFSFGELELKGKKASSVTIDFGGASTISYRWSNGEWLRSENEAPFEIEGAGQLGVENVLIEEHEINFSSITDVAGNPSIEIANPTGSGRAVLFRDGRAIVGRWSRESIEAEVAFETRAGEEFVFSPGSIWIHLVPSEAGEVKGSFTYAR